MVKPLELILGSEQVLTGFAHVGICVPDVDAATRWYCDVLGLQVLSPPYRMEGEAIERDMGELVPPPVVLKASVVGFGPDDHVLELIEYPEAPTPGRRTGTTTITNPGLTHVGLLCDDLEATRDELEAHGVEFLTAGMAEVAGLRTTWCVDPWGTVIILMEKKSATQPYWRQYES
jgi:catechol 2,3-dioxygenase-like lactoylglutathione lyase family enzyme